ncbi:MAG: hypothetical protein ACXVRZ_06605 [Gaiellaceae bacterium]
MTRMVESELFYLPEPALFRNADAFRLYTGYAAGLEAAGLADRFPQERDVRQTAIEVLAERCAVEDVAQDPALIDDAVLEAHVILDERAADDG